MMAQTGRQRTTGLDSCQPFGKWVMFSATSNSHDGTAITAEPGPPRGRGKGGQQERGSRQAICGVQLGKYSSNTLCGSFVATFAKIGALAIEPGYPKNKRRSGKPFQPYGLVNNHATLCFDSIFGSGSV